jgi:hypothetical protein
VPEHRRHLGHDAAEHHLLAEEGASAGERRSGAGLDASAGGVEQPDHGDALAQRELAHPRRLVLVDRAHRTGHHGEVVRAHRDAATVDRADPRHAPVGGERATLGEAGIHVVGELAELDERPGVKQEVEPLAHGQLAHLALAGDALLAAHGQRPLAPLAEVADERLPVVQLGVLHQRPFHSGLRFSAKAAMPSAASSVPLVTVSSGCSNRKAASAGWSSTA